MEFNVLSSALCTINLTEGNKSIPLFYSGIVSTYGDSPIATLSGTDVLVVDFDMGCRTHIDRFEYKFIDFYSTPQSTLSGIDFYYKNEQFEDYTLLPKYERSPWIFSTTTSGSLLIPRYLRCRHAFPLTSTSGSVYGFMAINSEDIVNFGEDGSKQYEAIDVARAGVADIRPIPIYNNGSSMANAIISIEPSFSDIDNALSISLSSSGPWVDTLSEGDIILSASNINAGLTDGTIKDYGVVTTESVPLANDKIISSNSSGKYTTRIFKKSNFLYDSKIVIDSGINTPGRIAVDDTDSIETIEIRSSNVTPKPYAVIRTLYNNIIGGLPSLSYRDLWLTTQQIKETNTTALSTAPASYFSWEGYGVVFDQVTERWAYWAEVTSNDYRASSKLYLFNHAKSSSPVQKTLASQSTNNTPMNYSFKELMLDSYGGVWAYFFCQGYSVNDYVDATGYFLCCFDSNLNSSFKWFTSEEEVGHMDVDYTTRELWYTRPRSSTLYKIGVTGSVIAEFAEEGYTDDLGGLAVLPDSRVIYGNGVDLHYLKYNGVIDDTLSIYDVATDSVGYIVLDGDGSEAIWMIDGLSVCRLIVSGENKGKCDFRVENIGFPSKLKSVSGGVWVKCTESEFTTTITMKFISKENRRVDTSYATLHDSFPAVIYQTYENVNYTSRTPIDGDTVWPYLPWNKVSTHLYNLAEDLYYQIRLTLRRQTLYEAWPDIVGDPTQLPVSSDYFTQTSSTPNQLIWGNWSNKPSTSNVYVNTTSGTLFINSGDVVNNYIDTSDRVVWGVDSNNLLEMVVGYRIAYGSSAASGKAEEMSIRLVGVDPGFETNYYYCKLFIPVNPLGGVSYMHCGNYLTTESATQLNLTTGTAYYEGEIGLTLNKSNDTFSIKYRPKGSSPWTFSLSRSLYTNTTFGDHFKLYITAINTGSNLQIDYVYANNGVPFHYIAPPIVNKIYTQRLISLDNISPKSSKDIYLRTSADADLNLLPNYSADLNVKWRVNSN